MEVAKSDQDKLNATEVKDLINLNVQKMAAKLREEIQLS